MFDIQEELRKCVENDFKGFEESFEYVHGDVRHRADSGVECPLG